MYSLVDLPGAPMDTLLNIQNSTILPSKTSIQHMKPEKERQIIVRLFIY